MTESSKNQLYYGDNLDILRRYVKDETVDLVYLDPPFNSNANYNVLFAEKNGSQAASQIQAFTDTWTWNQESGIRINFCGDRDGRRTCGGLPSGVSDLFGRMRRAGLSRDDGAAPGKGETPKAAEASAEYGGATKRLFHVVGEPASVPDAAALAASDPYQFQWWALGLVGARPVEQKKGADKGIDGRIIFQGDKPGSFESVILSVKAGKTGSSHVRDLKGVLEREKAAIGVLISMQEPTAAMKTEAVTAGFYESALWGKKYPKVQLLTVEELLTGKKVEMPPIRQVGQRSGRLRR